MQTARKKIQTALVDLLKTIKIDNGFSVDLFDRVYDRQIFYDDVRNYPEVCVIKGPETRKYEPGMQAWGNIQFIIRIWTKDSQTTKADEQLENIFGEIENLLQNNTRLLYDTNQHTVDILIDQITDDEGLMAEEGKAMGEMELTILRHLTMN